MADKLKNKEMKNIQQCDFKCKKDNFFTLILFVPFNNFCFLNLCVSDFLSNIHINGVTKYALIINSAKELNSFLLDFCVVSVPKEYLTIYQNVKITIHNQFKDICQ